MSEAAWVQMRDRRGSTRTIAARKAGFTLVEMLVVLAIIGLIVGIAAPRVFNQLAGAKVRTAKVQIESLKSALDLFFLDVGRYPTTSEGLGVLMVRPSNAGAWNGPYVKSTTVPRDPWNQEYVYHSPGQDGRPYEIVSLGADGHGDSGGDVKSW
ncbi:MAG TPA: type II secretion system major pseudopilin GspG [Rhodopseudomonas sp.]|uniref:type II secretion system major pseudopilin GspG n=1 Tax=Rhodopseudomonas sp. TaxID=1078 RepID=UPI002EDA5C37